MATTSGGRHHILRSFVSPSTEPALLLNQSWNALKCRSKTNRPEFMTLDSDVREQARRIASARRDTRRTSRSGGRTRALARSMGRSTAFPTRCVNTTTSQPSPTRPLVGPGVKLDLRWALAGPPLAHDVDRERAAALLRVAVTGVAALAIASGGS